MKANSPLIETLPKNRISDTETADLMRRICQHHGIAFSANKVAPSLADLNQSGTSVNAVEELNVIGKHFGIRFREMSGSMRELSHTVSETGMVLAKSDSNSSKPASKDSAEPNYLSLIHI